MLRASPTWPEWAGGVPSARGEEHDYCALPRACSRAPTLLVTAFAVPASATPVPSTPDAGHQPSKHHFSAAAQSFVGADTVQKRVAKLEAAMATLPKESTAYSATKLWNEGITGEGSTVATLVSLRRRPGQGSHRLLHKTHGLPQANVESSSRPGDVPACTDPGVDSDLRRAGRARPTSTSRCTTPSRLARTSSSRRPRSPRRWAFTASRDDEGDQLPARRTRRCRSSR